jgi:ectoine hydroxylase
MRLSNAQLRQFDEQGYVFFPDCFSEEEIALLRAEWIAHRVAAE